MLSVLPNKKTTKYDDVDKDNEEEEEQTLLQINYNIFTLKYFSNGIARDQLSHTINIIPYLISEVLGADETVAVDIKTDED